MADIQITVDNTTGLFGIALDKWEWTGLTVNGTAVQAQSGNVQFSWNQQTAGPVHFVVTANQNLVIQNPGNLLFIQSEDKTKTFAATISYEATAQQVTLTGLLVGLGFLVPGSQPGPLTFSQGRMTGTFKRVTS